MSDPALSTGVRGTVFTTKRVERARGMTAWPAGVERVAAFVRDAGAEARIEEFEEGTSTAVEAAAAIGCEVSVIVKTLLFLCDGRPVAALVPGDRRASPAKIAAAARARRARIAGAEQVLEVTGFEPGAVAPFPLPAGVPVFLDQTLLAHPVVWAGSGSTRHLIGLAPGELVRLADARSVDILADG